ncbi:hypothetical protein GOV07_02575 [Candidatus Woesearchaeota archaeon]|nr:hypothetical protein [Candidatus Woesearchaeota archaeon]
MKLNTPTLATFLLLGILLASSLALAAPSGARITYNSTDYGPTISPQSHTANRSTITTIILDAVQQNQYWKAYVGNVTGTLTLDDVNNNTIYDWTTTTVSGEVYASRSTLDFGTVACADTATISAEEAAMNMTTPNQADNITSTFNSTDHTDTFVAGTNLQNCPMTSLYVNDVSQGQNNAADFQEFLMEEAGNNLVYVSIINDNTAGFDNARNFDFQMIVAESDRNALAYTYYFYVELGS